MADAATAAATAVASTVGDSYLLSSYGLAADSAVFRLGALSVIFLEELVRLYAPLVFKGLSFVLLCLPLPNIFGSVDLDGEQDGDLASQSSSADAPVIPEEYATFVDDRKASRGDENDVHMLQTHGFNKYRHVSAAFLKRNNLTPTDATQEDEEEDSEEKGSGSDKLDADEPDDDFDADEDDLAGKFKKTKLPVRRRGGRGRKGGL